MSAPGACKLDNVAARRRRAVFLDRDGVLNRAVVVDGRPYPPICLAELELLPNVDLACRRLAESGALLICVTNQPDVARGTQSAAEVKSINDWLRMTLGLFEVRACFHDERDGCFCRKPRPGMLIEAARQHGIDLAGSIMVGDRWRDIEAGRNAGCRTVFLNYEYNERQPQNADFTFRSLLAAVPTILSILKQ